MYKFGQRNPLVKTAQMRACHHGYVLQAFCHVIVAVPGNSALF
jgi:hypothetical protein